MKKLSLSTHTTWIQLKENTKLFTTFALAIILLQSCMENKTPMNTSSRIFVSDIKAPIAAKIDTVLEIHNDKRIDPYYWLNDRENEDVISYLNLENAYTEKAMEGTIKLQDSIYKEITERIDPNNTSVPYFKNGYFYITRYEEGKEYPIYSRKKGSLEAKEEILLDVNQMAEGYEYYNVNSLSVSPDNKWLAFGVDTVSRRIYTIYFKNLISNEVIEESIPNNTGSCSWANDSKTVFYAVKDETLRPYQIYRYQKDTNQKPILIYEEKDPTFNTFVYKSRTNKYIIIGSYATLSNEYRILDADNPTGEFTIFQPRVRGLEYNIAHADGIFYIVTNEDAENFKVMTTDEKNTLKESWKEYIPHKKEVLIESLIPFEKYIVINQRKEGLSQLEIRDLETNESYDFPTEEQAYVVGTQHNPEYRTNTVRVHYESMVTPATTYDLNMLTKKKTLLKQLNVPTYQPENYKMERFFIAAKDGAQVPVSVVMHKDFKKDGSHPVALYGYGSYGNSMDPHFSFSRISLLDRGFAWAIAHIRGGQEMGRQWYENGKLLNKKNTFTDFIRVGEALIEKKYSHPDKLCAIGGSAGGLLMGAVINMNSALWAAVIAAVPFVDVITTMLDESIPLTTGEYDEWGNPNDKIYYDYIKSYSPYDNIEEKEYPALLVTTGLHDSQVQYWEPAKWVAKLRDMKTDMNPLLLHTNMETGHSGASGRYARYRETALEYAFLIESVK